MRFLVYFVLYVSFVYCGPIKHIILLMEENRAFDHMFGWHKGVNGLTGNEWNPNTTLSPNFEKVYVTDQGTLLGRCDPDHSTPATTSKIFGKKAVEEGDFSQPLMNGFVEWQLGLNGETCYVMDSQGASALPVLTFLAGEYALFDHFFAAHPGPTWPNRLFTLLGTSGGLTETSTWYQGVQGRLFPFPSIFDQLSAEGLTWRNYYNDTPWELFLESLAHNPDHLFNLDQFFEDCRTGDLPNFAWINPRAAVNVSSGLGSTDQHPDHDLANGEAYYKAIYEAVRASPAWESTLLLITYDEHGGYYDHVPPPMGVPPPDDLPSYPDKNFTFDRLGIRIPMIAISPWIERGVVVGRPAKEARPAPNSEYTLTSVLGTVRRLLGMSAPPLTARDAWSAPLDTILTQTLRSDCPLHTPPAPAPALAPEAEGRQALNDLQRHIATVHAHLAALATDFPARTQADLGDWFAAAYEQHRTRTLAWRASQQAPWGVYFALRVAEPTRVKAQWAVTTDPSVTFLTVSADGVCLSVPSAIAGAPLQGTLCYPSEDPATNRDPAQHWIWGEDSSIRPAADTSLCLTSPPVSTQLPSKSTLEPAVTLEMCDGRVEQHFQYGGEAPGSTYNGGIQLANPFTYLVLYNNTNLQ